METLASRSFVPIPDSAVLCAPVIDSDRVERTSYNPAVKRAVLSVLLLDFLLLGLPALAQSGDGGEQIGVPYMVDTPTGAKEALDAAIQAAADRNPDGRTLRRVRCSLASRWPRSRPVPSGWR